MRRRRRRKERIKIFTREIPYLGLGKDSTEFFFLNAPGLTPRNKLDFEIEQN